MEASSEQWIISLVYPAATILLEIFLCGGLQLMSKITFDVVKEMRDVTHAKDVVRNIYTNIALVSALLLTVALAMIQQDPPSCDNDDVDAGCTLQILYVTSVWTSGLFLIKITLECIVNLVFTEGLPHYMVLRYLVSFPGSIGGPVIGLTIAITSLLIGIAVWLSMEYSLASGVGFAAGSGYFLSHLTCLIKAKRNFSSVRGSEGARSWEWIEKDQLHEYTHHTSLFGTSTWAIPEPQRSFCASVGRRRFSSRRPLQM